MVRVTGGGVWRGSLTGPADADRGADPTSADRTAAAAADDSPARSGAAAATDGPVATEADAAASHRRLRDADRRRRARTARDAAAAGPPGRGGAGLAQISPSRPAGGVVDGVGRTSSGRRGGAGGAWPVFGSSTRKRSVGGTMRPGAGSAGRAGRRRRCGPRPAVAVRRRPARRAPRPAGKSVPRSPARSPGSGPWRPPGGARRSRPRALRRPGPAQSLRLRGRSVPAAVRLRRPARQSPRQTARPPARLRWASTARAAGFAVFTRGCGWPRPASPA